MQDDTGIDSRFSGILYNHTLHDETGYDSSETHILQIGWNWVSFPRLDRTDNNYVEVISVLESINDFPVELLLLGRSYVKR